MAIVDKYDVKFIPLASTLLIEKVTTEEAIGFDIHDSPLAAGAVGGDSEAYFNWYSKQPTGATVVPDVPEVPLVPLEPLEPLEPLVPDEPDVPDVPPPPPAPQPSVIQRL